LVKFRRDLHPQERDQAGRGLNEKKPDSVGLFGNRGVL